MKILYLILLLSFNALGTTCVQSTEESNIQSSPLIEVEIKETDTGYNVLLFFPEKVKELPLSYVVLHLGSYDSPIFSSQLDIGDENGKPFVFYVTNGHRPTALISVTYGHDCGIQIYKKVA